MRRARDSLASDELEIVLIGTRFEGFRVAGIELDIVLDPRDRQRPEKQQDKDDESGCVIHRWRTKS